MISTVALLLLIRVADTLVNQSEFYIYYTCRLLSNHIIQRAVMIGVRILRARRKETTLSIHLYPFIASASLKKNNESLLFSRCSSTTTLFPPLFAEKISTRSTISDWRCEKAYIHPSYGFEIRIFSTNLAILLQRFHL